MFMRNNNYSLFQFFCGECSFYIHVRYSKQQISVCHIKFFAVHAYYNREMFLYTAKKSPE